MEPAYSFTRYLSAKKSVDDRALNRGVWEALAAALPPSTPQAPLRVLEIGAGIGTMVERMLDWGLLAYADYTGLDAQPDNIAHASERLPHWAKENGYQVESRKNGALVLVSDSARLQAHFKAVDLFDFISERDETRWDLLVANAFLDLVDIPRALPHILSLCRPGGLFYFSINFDGGSIFEPVIDSDLDAQIERLYHQDMDARQVDGRSSGDSRAGRHLFAHLRAGNAQVLAAGASDWVVFPHPEGYPHDEGYFLHHIIETIHRALRAHPGLDSERFERWVAGRHAQIERSELVYIAHQLDYAGRVVS